MLYNDALQRTQDEYDAAVQAGKFTRAPSLVSSLNVLLLVVWLLSTRGLSEYTYRAYRWPAFVAVVAASAWSLFFCRSPGVVGSIGVGLNAALVVILAMNLILMQDPRQLKRLSSKKRPIDSSSKLFWQPMPDTLSARVPWILDLLTSLRGQYWSWDCPAKNDRTQSVKLPPDQDLGLVRSASRFLLDYMALDLIKCTMIADSYFYSGNHSDLPPAYVVNYLNSDLAVYLYRISLCAAGIVAAIDLEFTTVRLVYVNIVGPRIVGIYGSPSAFQPLWGAPAAILRKGLRGFWTETWHQTLRLHFSQVGDAVATCLVGPQPDMANEHRSSPACRNPKYQSTIRMTVGFLLSGFIHACGSYALLGPTRPWAPFFFFALQPVGIALQISLACILLRKASQAQAGNPGRSRILMLYNAASTSLWLGSTAQLLMDDFSSGGMWLFEPVPLSLIRGLGFSAQDQRFWCW